MVTLKFSKNSWHYKLASFGTSYDYFISDNLCKYCWQVIKGFAFGLLVLSFFTVILYCAIVEPIIYLLVVYETGIWVMPTSPALPIGLGVWGAVFIILLGHGIRVSYSKYKNNRRIAQYNAQREGLPQPKDSFIVAVWRKFHDKTCAKLEFK